VILDDMVSANPRLFAAVKGAHAVEVPVELCPVDWDGGLGLRWTRAEEQAHLVPRVRANRFHLDATYIRPPYPRVVLFRNGEPGCALMERLPEHLITGQVFSGRETAEMRAYADRHYPELSGKALTAAGKAIDGWSLWMLALLRGRVYCFLAVRWFAVETDVGMWLATTMNTDDAAPPMLQMMNGFLQNEWATFPRAEQSEADYELDRNNFNLGVAAALNLMNCKNVTQREVSPPRQQVRHHLRKGLLPLFRYHTLVIRTKAHRDAGEEGAGDPIALHWTRGHFKDYREGGGLFGQMHGLYWWSPFMAGKADRIVTKDYRVQP